MEFEKRFPSLAGITAMIILVMLTVSCSSPDQNTNSTSNNNQGTLTSTDADHTAQSVSGLGKASITGKLEVTNGPALGIFVFAEGTSHIAVTDSRGEFEMTDLSIGQYNIRASRGDIETVMLADLLITTEDVNGDSNVLNVGTHQVDSLGSGYGRGVAAGAKVTGVIQPLRSDDRDGALIEIAGTQIRTTTDSQGQFILLNVPQGDFTVRISQEGYLPANRPVTVSGNEDIDLGRVILSPRNLDTLDGHSIIGEIVYLDFKGEPVSNFRNVFLTLNKSGQRYYPDRDGRFKISGLEASEYIVNIDGTGFLRVAPKVANLINTRIAEVQFVIEQNPDEVDLTGFVIGQVILEDSEDSGNAGVIISLTGTSLTATSDSIGTFQIPGVEPGIYTVVASYEGYETAFVENVEVGEQEIVELDPIILEPEIIRPTVVATSPSDGDLDVTILDPTLVQIVFDQNMDPSSVRQSVRVSPDVDFRVRTNGQHPLADQDRIVIELAGYSAGGEVLKFGKRYTVRIDSSASNVEGLEMEEDFRFSFTTGRAKVTGTFPEDGQREVFVNETNPIRVFFNVGLDTDLFDRDDVRIRPQPATQPNVYVVNDRETGWGVLVIGVNLEFGEDYEISIRDGIRTLTNDRISNLPYRFSFDTTTRTEGIDVYNNDEDRRERVRQERNRK